MNMNNMLNAARGSFEKRFGPPLLKNVHAMYKKLSPADIDKLVQKHGEAKVMAFVRDMEYKNAQENR